MSGITVLWLAVLAGLYILIVKRWIQVALLMAWGAMALITVVITLKWLVS